MLSRLFRFLSAKRGQEMPAVTTKGGDSGKSALYSGEFLPKSDIHFEVIGDIDELSSLLGLARHQLRGRLQQRVGSEFEHIQKLLHHAMAVIATRRESELYGQLPRISDSDVEWIEKRQAWYAEKTRIEPRFILPGEKSEASAWIDLCRSITRRCERRIVHFIGQEQHIVYEDLYCIQRFFNRLSDFLFVLARHIENAI
ncbi:cob(I)yrinic acid a,c-diamide adenosyltransferase [Spirochaeta dissipatitropha]